MKHVKELVLERRNFRSYVQYNSILKRKFEQFNKVDKLLIYEEDKKMVNIEIKFYGNLEKDLFDYVKQEIGEVYYI